MCLCSHLTVLRFLSRQLPRFDRLFPPPFPPSQDSPSYEDWFTFTERHTIVFGVRIGSLHFPHGRPVRLHLSHSLFLGGNYPLSAVSRYLLLRSLPLYSCSCFTPTSRLLVGTLTSYAGLLLGSSAASQSLLYSGKLLYIGKREMRGSGFPWYYTYLWVAPIMQVFG